MKRWICLLLCLCLTGALFAGCTGEEDYVPTGDGLGEAEAPTDGEDLPEQGLVLTYYKEKTLNPILCDDYTNRALLSLLYQSLFTVDSDYNVEPQLCKSYRISEDMKTYTFYLEDATFSDGKTVTAADVVASYDAARESDVYGGRFTHISSVKKSEDGGITFTVDTPMENLPLLLTVPIIRAKEVKSKRPVGSGPYILDESGSAPCLRLRDNWWCQAKMPVSPPVITLLTAVSNPQIRDNFQFGGLNVVCADPGSDRYADYRCDYELWSCENGIFLFLACSADSPVFSNQAVRVALTHAIDRDTITQKHYRDFAQAATLPASPQFPHYSQALAAKYGYEPKKFTKAVKDEGFVGAEVTLLVNSGDSLRTRVAREIAQALTESGLKVTVSELAGSKYQNAVRNRAYDLYLGQTVLSPNMDLSAFFHTYGSLSFGGVNNVSAYALCKEALANYGNYYSLYKFVMENGLLCPVLTRSYGIYGTRGVASELTPARDNVFYYSLGKTMEQALIRK